MNVLFYSTVYPHPTAPVRGTFNWELCHAVRRFADVRVVAPRGFTEVVRAWRRSNTKLTNDIPTLWPTFGYPVKFFKHTYGAWMWHGTKHAVRRMTADFKPDWVVSYWAHPDGEAAQRAAQELRAKNAVIVGGSDVLLLPKDPKRRACVSRVLAQADVVITVCEGLSDEVIKLGADPARVHRLYQGVDQTRFKKGDQRAARQSLGLPATADSHQPPIFLWVGRMVELKRLDLILRAFARVRVAEPAALLCLCGSGPMLAKTQQMAQQMQLQDSVRFVGAVPQSQLPTWYQAADATVMASSSEGLPNVLRESLACGTPFVATDVGSICEITDPTHSLLVPSGDEDALATSMQHILDPIFSSGAKLYVPKTWADSARKLVGILEDAAKNAPSSTEAHRHLAEAAP